MARTKSRRTANMDPRLVKLLASLQWAKYREQMVRHRLLGENAPRIRVQLQSGSKSINKD